MSHRRDRGVDVSGLARLEHPRRNGEQVIVDVGFDNEVYGGRELAQRFKVID